MSFYQWEIRSEIHGTVCEWLSGGGPFRGEERRPCQLPVDFELLACSAPLNIVFNVGPQAWPPIMLLNRVVHL